MFNQIFKKKQLPVSYQIEHPSEIVELFSRLTLHHQTALLRLISRNVVMEIDGKTIMGYEMDFDVKGAVIQGTIEEDLT
jgi:hypothetical protein|tara:strand:+ start:1252 stop:1488 length:237 start_codon:yes stop_codon:yes gene_type:complete